MKHRVSVTVDKDNYQVLSAAGVNISGLVNDAIGKEARRIKAEEWKKENREGMEEVARFISQNGSFADENRNW
ncbi:type II toxin-antitoxin system antitoxin CcdA [Pectobacterium odoriferum]|uniref:type II toxin-antitoxin system antitoxin CcdA n=1 Tax=Pectobacteriaceae TaxID=1903410 RepID=UPI0015841CCD|nr:MULTISPECIES: type II toxin-antitoxin system antitoxin CcdA [Pectobacteriaceae]MBA0211576.1 type II toxin-antitoxin system antitoxin CcdA [Pectobacterium brasiliense]MBB1526963.1 type II toxin-antitoxin system antitoxin CcdA [Pectobacterium carotovorum subsp. carotovorum]MCA7014697.1 type II toxin-antitoxin system antitoxin CcdA [Dickeya dadantii]